MAKGSQGMRGTKEGVKLTFISFFPIFSWQSFIYSSSVVMSWILMLEHEVKTLPLTERKQIVEDLGKQAKVVLRSLVQVNGFEVIVDDIKDNEYGKNFIVRFKIGDKNYSISANINRDRKGHWESKYVGSPGCGTSMSDSPYEDYWVNDEEE